MCVSNPNYKIKVYDWVGEKALNCGEQLPLYDRTEWNIVCPFSSTFQTFQKYYNDVENKSFKQTANNLNNESQIWQ